MTKRIKSPVLFDANILVNFSAQLGFMFSFFENILIHKKVLEEILEDSIKDEIDLIQNEQGNIMIVDDKILYEEVEKVFFERCDKELKNAFNISNLKDLGEYKTLLYAKFNNVKLLSSQDTTVWRFITDSTYFNAIECIAMQDIAFLIYLNASNKQERKLAKRLYNHFGRGEHPFDYFKSYMNRYEDKIPKYIEFENNRIDNFNQLVKGYIDFYGKEMFCSRKEIEREVVQATENHADTCVSCLYSRIDQDNVDYLTRLCGLNYELFDEDCTVIREGFSEFIKRRK